MIEKLRKRFLRRLSNYQLFGEIERRGFITLDVSMRDGNGDERYLKMYGTEQLGKTIVIPFRGKMP